MSGEIVRWISEGPLAMDRVLDKVRTPPSQLYSIQRFVNTAVGNLPGVETIAVSDRCTVLYYPRDVFAVCVLWVDESQYKVTATNIANNRYSYGVERHTWSTKLLSKAVSNVARSVRRMTDDAYIGLGVQWYDYMVRSKLDRGAEAISKAATAAITGQMELHTLLDDLFAFVNSGKELSESTKKALYTHRKSTVQSYAHRESIAASRLVVPTGADYAMLSMSVSEPHEYRRGIYGHRFSADDWDKKLYSREQLPSAVQARMAVLDMVETEDLVEGVGARTPMGHLPATSRSWNYGGKPANSYPTNTKSVYVCLLSEDELNA